MEDIIGKTRLKAQEWAEAEFAKFQNHVKASPASVIWYKQNYKEASAHVFDTLDLQVERGDYGHLSRIELFVFETEARNRLSDDFERLNNEMFPNRFGN